jgi:hypothetical protein
MTARKNQPQSVVFESTCLLIHQGCWVSRMHFELICNRCKCGIKSRATAQPVNRFESPGGDEPRSGFFGEAIPWPGIQRGGKRVVRSFLGQIETAQQANQRRKYAPRIRAVERLDLLEALRRRWMLLIRNGMLPGEKV